MDFGGEAVACESKLIGADREIRDEIEAIVFGQNGALVIRRQIANSDGSFLEHGAGGIEDGAIDRPEILLRVTGENNQEEIADAHHERSNEFRHYLHCPFVLDRYSAGMHLPARESSFAL
jgi:hypothetical protein